VQCGIPKENTFVLSNGDVLSLSKSWLKKSRSIQTEDVYVDGSRIGDVGNVVIKDRKLMSNNGILAIIINLDVEKKLLLNKPAITTRGFILVNENEELIKEIQINI
jgi:ribonuclease J